MAQLVTSKAGVSGDAAPSKKTPKDVPAHLASRCTHTVSQPGSLSSSAACL